MRRPLEPLEDPSIHLRREDVKKAPKEYGHHVPLPHTLTKVTERAMAAVHVVQKLSLDLRPCRREQPPLDERMACRSTVGAPARWGNKRGAWLGPTVAVNDFCAEMQGSLLRALISIT